MHKTVLFAALVALSSVHGKDRKFTIINQCDKPIWTGIFNTLNHPPIVFAESKEKTTGFKLEAKGDKKILTAPELWGGRIWPRTECKKQKDGKFVCKSGDCEGTDENCGTTGDVCTLGEWTLAPENKPEGSVAPDADWYDLSLVDGKIKVLVADDLAVDLSIVSDILETCPKELLSNDGTVCSSACKKGIGPFNVPGTCTADMVDYYHVFKDGCSDGYAHAYDDDKALQKCPKAVQPDYTITFCPDEAPSFVEQQKAFASGAGDQRQPAAEQQPGAQQPTPGTTAGQQPPASQQPPADAQPSSVPPTDQPKKRASLLASNVCTPPGFTMVKVDGQQPQGECVPKDPNAVELSDAKNDQAAETKPTPPAEGTEAQPGQDGQKTQGNANGDPDANANSPGAPGSDDAGKQTHDNAAGANAGTPAHDSSGDASKQPDAGQLAGGVPGTEASTPGQPAPVPGAGEQPAGQPVQASGGNPANTPNVKTADGNAGNAQAGGPLPNLSTQSGAEGAPADGTTPNPGDTQAESSNKHPCMGKKRHAGMKRLEEDARM
ncbi:hypothetical protein QFC20_001093 [Naganishia adeliensis]|uniref:Uncharacterized protein n=1 Tax=Naganishia adeliensis TaxID=92952 RepID=A0ACC2WWP0_9TREE|nr:hypothetical protein QFC20_001093 [Naganishia adeliensis]